MAVKLWSLIAALAVLTQMAGAATYRGSVSLLSYQDTFTVISGGQNATANGTSIGICPGVEYENALGGNFTWSSGLCAMIATAFAGFSGVAPGNITYAPAGQTSIGLLFQPGAWWHPPGTHVALGLGIPVLLKSTNWPVPPGADGKVSKDSLFGVGLSLATRLSRDNFFATPRVGFLETLGRYFWSLELGLKI